MERILLVGLGGLFGSIIRFLIGEYMASPQLTGIPVHTLMVNLIGSFIIGAFLVISSLRTDNYFFLFLIPGLLGGFTTYSAFSAETFLLIKNNLVKDATLYVLLTVFGGLVATASGYWIGRTIIKIY